MLTPEIQKAFVGILNEELKMATGCTEPIALAYCAAKMRQVLGAEVKDQPLEEAPLLGMDQDRLRYVSHHVREEIGIDHPVPGWEMGELALRLNTIRTQVRETELAAAAAFEYPGEAPREDIIRELAAVDGVTTVIEA